MYPHQDRKLLCTVKSLRSVDVEVKTCFVHWVGVRFWILHARISVLCRISRPRKWLCKSDWGKSIFSDGLSGIIDSKPGVNWRWERLCSQSLVDNRSKETAISIEGNGPTASCSKACRQGGGGQKSLASVDAHV